MKSNQKKSRVKKTIAWSIVFIILSAVLFTGGMSLLGWNFWLLDTGNYNEKQFVATAEIDPITQISLDTRFPVKVLLGEEVSLKYYDSDDITATVKAANGKLELEESHKKNWWRFFNFVYPTIELTVPNGTEILLDSSNCAFDSEGINFSKITINSSNATINLRKCEVQTLQLDADNLRLSMADNTFGRTEIKSNNFKFNGDNNVFGDTEIESSNIKLTTEHSEFTSLTLNGSNVSARLNHVTMQSLKAKSSNLKVLSDSLTCNKLTLEGSNITARLTLTSPQALYTVEGHTLNGKLPPNQSGSDPDKTIYIKTSNFSGHINFTE